MNQEFKNKIKKRLYEMMDSEVVTDTPPETPLEQQPNRAPRLTIPFKRPDPVPQFEPGDVENPDPSRGWPTSAPTYVGPEGQQVWVIPGPPPKIFIYIPSNQQGVPGFYFYLVRQKFNNAGLHTLYNWSFHRWNHLSNDWQHRGNGDYIHDILQTLPGFEQWQDPTTAPGPGWEAVPPPQDGTLGIPGEDPWMDNPRVRNRTRNRTN